MKKRIVIELVVDEPEEGDTEAFAKDLDENRYLASIWYGYRQDDIHSIKVTVDDPE